MCESKKYKKSFTREKDLAGKNFKKICMCWNCDYNSKDHSTRCSMASNQQSQTLELEEDIGRLHSTTGGPTGTQQFGSISWAGELGSSIGSQSMRDTGGLHSQRLKDSRMSSKRARSIISSSDSSEESQELSTGKDTSSSSLGYDSELSEGSFLAATLSDDEALDSWRLTTARRKASGSSGGESPKWTVQEDNGPIWRK